MTVIDLCPSELRDVLQDLPRSEALDLAREFLEASDGARADVMEFLHAGLRLVEGA